MTVTSDAGDGSRSQRVGCRGEVSGNGVALHAIALPTRHKELLLLRLHPHARVGQHVQGDLGVGARLQIALDYYSSVRFRQRRSDEQRGEKL